MKNYVFIEHTSDNLLCILFKKYIIRGTVNSCMNKLRAYMQRNKVHHCILVYDGKAIKKFDRLVSDYSDIFYQQMLSLPQLFHNPDDAALPTIDYMLELVSEDYQEEWSNPDYWYVQKLRDCYEYWKETSFV